MNWEEAKAFEKELEKLDVKRPRTMMGITKVGEGVSEEMMRRPRLEGSVGLPGLAGTAMRMEGTSAV